MQVIYDNIIYVKTSKYCAKVGTGSNADHNAIEDVEKIIDHVIINDSVLINGRKLTVTKLSYSCFCNFSKLKSVTIPNTIIQIENAVFWLCTSLTKVEFVPGSRLQSIGYKFLDSTYVSELFLPGTLKSISNDFIYNINCDIEITYCGSKIFSNALFGNVKTNIKINVHEGYKGTTFGQRPVNVSNNIMCPSVVYQNKYTRHCSIVVNCRTSRLRFFLQIIIMIS